MKQLKKLIFFSIMGGLSMSGVTHAITIQNEIDVQASTGGNSTNSATEGGGRASVFIETIVDGKVVQYVDEEVVSKKGESIKIEKQIEYKDDQVKVGLEAQTQADLQDEEEIEEYQAGERENKKSAESDKNNHEAENQVEEQQEQISSKAKPLVVSIVEFFRNMFSRFFS